MPLLKIYCFPGDDTLLWSLHCWEEIGKHQITQLSLLKKEHQPRCSAKCLLKKKLLSLLILQRKRHSTKWKTWKSNLLKEEPSVNREDSASSAPFQIDLTVQWNLSWSTLYIINGSFLLLWSSPVPKLAQTVYPTHPAGNLPLPPISPWLPPLDPWLMEEERRGGRGGVQAHSEGRPASWAGRVDWRASLGTGVTAEEYWLQGLSPRDR